MESQQALVSGHLALSKQHAEVITQASRLFRLDRALVFRQGLDLFQISESPFGVLGAQGAIRQHCSTPCACPARDRGRISTEAGLAKGLALHQRREPSLPTKALCG